MGNKLLIIDGNNMVNRAYYAVPTLTDPHGRAVNAIKGSINILMKTIYKENPSHIMAVFDAKAKTFRHKAYPEYKGTRNAKPPELNAQIDAVEELFHLMGIRTFAVKGVEADDIAGSVACFAEKLDFEVVILSGDKDMLQLCSEKVSVKMPSNGGQYVLYDRDKFVEKYGFQPKEIIDYKALMGDPSDNIKGVPKIGEKTAMKLIQDFGTIEEIYTNIDKISKPSVKKALEDNRDLAIFSKKLVTICTKMTPAFPMDDLLIGPFDTPEAKNKLAEYNIRSNIKLQDVSKTA